MSTTLILDRHAPKAGLSAGAAAAQAVSSAYAFIVATLSSVMRPQAESPAEAVARLRMPAPNAFSHQ